MCKPDNGGSASMPDPRGRERKSITQRPLPLTKFWSKTLCFRQGHTLIETAGDPMSSSSSTTLRFPNSDVPLTPAWPSCTSSHRHISHAVNRHMVNPGSLIAQCPGLSRMTDPALNPGPHPQKLEKPQNMPMHVPSCAIT